MDRKRLQAIDELKPKKRIGKSLATVVAMVLGASSLPTLAAPATGADDWPQWRGENRDGVWNESGIIDELNEENVEVLWRMPLGSGYSGPTVANKRVFVMDRVTEPEQMERILCFDAVLGTELWTREYACQYRGIGYTAGPRASVTIDDNRAYALGSMGHLHCLDVGDGTVLWKRDLNEEYNILTDKADTNRMPIWGLAASPLIYDDLVIVHPGGLDGCSVVAFDKKTGEEEWRSMDDRAQYSSPVMVKQGGEDVMIIWTGDSVAGLRPDSGEVCWRIPFTPKNMPIGIATPVVEGNHVFLTSFYDGSMMIELDPDRATAKETWSAKGRDEQHTEALHSIISTPLMSDGFIYGVDSYGELRCINAETGERVWEDLTAVPKARWSTIHFVPQGDRVWMFTERGDLVLAKLSPDGYQEMGRVHVIDPTTDQLRRRGGVCWSHPAFAEQCVFVRNDEEIVCVSLKD